MKTGAHLLIGKGLVSTLDAAVSLHCDCIQLFLHNPRGWQRKPRHDSELDSFREAAAEKKISPVAIHMPYLVNLATDDRDVRIKSLRVLEIELSESEKMGASYYVIHPGSHRGMGIKKGIENVASGLKSFNGGQVRILLENTAGQGDSVGSRWNELGSIIDKLHGKAGVCFDTAHAFESGYDIRNPDFLDAMKREIEKSLGLRYILLIHANDSLTLKGSNVDRHQHIGRGRIGLKGFENLVMDDWFGSLPYIIETPKGSACDDKNNLKILRKLGEKYGKIQVQGDRGKVAGRMGKIGSKQGKVSQGQ
ncbi:MAG TPA: deoxyribonuclease IV [bacterium]|nr:deoxyribonuclease IV [bacterium]